MHPDTGKEVWVTVHGHDAGNLGNRIVRDAGRVDNVARMKKFRTHRIAFVTSGIGMALMILTAVWRVNPVEGSVMPDFLTGNPLGEALLLVLIVTCMPVWIPTVFSVVILASFVGFPESDGFVLANGAAVIVQGIVYFMLGKLMSGWAKRFRTGRNRTQ